LLELGFDDATPNSARDIRSWAHDYAASKVDIIDNRAKGVVCYDPGYTFVEKLQTVSTKFRRQQESGEAPVEFMRHYFDVYALLQRPEVRAFIPYQKHKTERFRQGDNPDIAKNEAFILSNPKTPSSMTSRIRPAARSTAAINKQSNRSWLGSGLGSIGYEVPL